MLISYDWLKEFIDLPRKYTPEALAAVLTEHTVEVDGVSRAADRFRHVVVARITAIKPHPNADKLRIATVTAGADARDVVCGAPNIAPGQLVPLALPGAVLPGGMTIAAAAIRGVESAGMLCAPDELGLGDGHDGILILEKRVKPGTPFGDYLKLTDVVFDIDNKSLTHRPDLWSHFGIARDLAAVLNLPFKPERGQGTAAAIAVDEARFAVRVSVADPAACPRYMAAAIGNITVASSPAWLQERLTAVGIRPISNIVDITNYVMYELGQPLHAFDAATLSADPAAAAIAVRPAMSGETITTLDGVVRPLHSDTLLITDGVKPVAVAGVMGGENSEITDATATVVLESATFDHRSIRATAKRLGLRTEASQRFEKALDPALAEAALARAIALIRELVPSARVIGPVVDVRAPHAAPAPIELDLPWLQAFIGEHINTAKAKHILARLGFTIAENGKTLAVTPPSWRATRDITRREDLAEEIVRVFGYGKLTTAMPRVPMRPPQTDPAADFLRRLREILAGPAAATEVMSYPFIGEDILKRFGLPPAERLRLKNPLSAQQSHLRQSLAVSLLPLAAQNQARAERLSFFEIGSVFMPFAGDLEERPGGGTLPYQEQRLALMAMAPDRDEAFARAKGMAERLAAELGLSLRYRHEEQPPEWVERAYAAQVTVAGEAAGTAYLAGTAAKRLGLKRPVAIVELSTTVLQRFAGAVAVAYQPLPKFPPAVRDLAFVVNDTAAFNDIRDLIAGFHPLIRQIELFDVFSGDQVGKGRKSLAFHITYQADRTLTNEEVDELQAKLFAALEQRFEAKVRDF